jgi:hypothetical protein
MHFPIVNNMEGRGSLRDIKEKADAKGKREELIGILEDFGKFLPSYPILSWFQEL